MATSEFRHRMFASGATPGWVGGALEKSPPNTPSASKLCKLWMVLDGITVYAAAFFATVWELRTIPIQSVNGLLRETVIQGRPIGILLALLSGFSLSLLLTGLRLHLYHPARLAGIFHEQRLTLQACLTSALFLTGTTYLIDASDIPRGIVLLTLGLVVVSLSLRRMLYRAMLYRRFNRGKGARNVLIVGTGPQAQAIRHHMDSLPHLGYSFKGFIELSDSTARFAATSDDVVGSLDTLFQHARQHFVDEVFVAAPCERGIVQAVLENARAHGVGLRVVPNIYYLLARNRPIEYIGHFATIPLHLCHGPESGLTFERRPRDRERSQAILALESHRREPSRTANQVNTFSGD